MSNPLILFGLTHKQMSDKRSILGLVKFLWKKSHHITRLELEPMNIGFELHLATRQSRWFSGKTTALEPKVVGSYPIQVICLWILFHSQETGSY